MVRTEVKREITNTEAIHQLWNETYSLLAKHQHQRNEYAENERVVETPDLHLSSTDTNNFLYASGKFIQGDLSEIRLITLEISPTHGVYESSFTMQQGEQISLEQVQRMRSRIAFLNAGLNEELDHKPTGSLKRLIATRAHRTLHS